MISSIPLLEYKWRASLSHGLLHILTNNLINCNKLAQKWKDLRSKSNIIYFLFQFELSSRIDALQTTLNQVRKETESEITRLREELLEKNQTLEKLQVQLKQQRDYDDLKRQSE